MKQPRARRVPHAHELLRKALDRQIRRNPAYSLRALARATGISPSYLSRMMKGTKPIAESHFEALAKNLQMDDSSRRLLREAMLRAAVRSRRGASSFLDEVLERTPERPAVSRLGEYHEGSLRDFSELFDPPWQLALLDLVTCVDFRPDPAWIAERLGITSRQAKESMRRLQGMGLIREQDGRWEKVASKLRFPTTQSHPAIRGRHKRMMDEAIRQLTGELDDAAFNRRLIAGVSFAADPKNLPRARERLLEALFEVAEILADGDCVEVYQLSAQLFPLTRRRASST